MTDILLTALIAALIVFGLWKAEQFYQIWRWKRARKRQPPKLSVDESTKGFVDGAAEAVACGRCGALTTQFFEYADGDRWCRRCDEEEEN